MTSRPFALRAESGLAPVLAIGSMMSIQLAAALSKPLLAEIGATTTTTVRLAAGAAFLLAITRPRLLKQKAGAVTSALLLGIALAGMTVCFFEAVHRIPLGLASTVAFTGPLAVATLGSHRLVDFGFAALAAAGLILLLLPYSAGWAVDPAGLAFAAGAACCWALYIILTKRVGAVFDGLQGLAISLLVAAAAALPLGLYQLQSWPHLWQVGSAAALALLAPILPCALEMIALRRMGTRPFGILMSLEPAIGVAIGYMLLRQQPNPAQILGVLCVVVASAGSVFMAGRPTAPVAGRARSLAGQP
jgi:inner membrane transporter RhtA